MGQRVLLTFEDGATPKQIGEALDSAMGQQYLASVHLDMDGEDADDLVQYLDDERVRISGR